LPRSTTKLSHANGRAYAWVVDGIRLRAMPIRLSRPTRPAMTFDRVHGLEPWKRGLDVALSATAIVLSAPLVGVIALLVKLTSKGPVFVTQERIGLNRRVSERRNNGGRPRGTERRGQPDRRATPRYGKPFKMYKFRSMRDGAENGRPVWAAEDDPRITPVGRVLRKTRMDEIPQFVNVLRGDMSVVGPRPEREYFYGALKRDLPDFPFRLRAKPGITGLAQVNNGYANSVAGTRVKLHHDLDYIRNLRPSTDAKILLKTISVVFTGKGAC
jgi:lipopolysaccharide/colanic/teichoic acid biosynthesis glycosyltransferase